MSLGFVPGLGKAFQEHTHLSMQEIIEWVQVLLNGKTCVTWTGKDFVTRERRPDGGSGPRKHRIEHAAEQKRKEQPAGDTAGPVRQSPGLAG